MENIENNNQTLDSKESNKKKHWQRNRSKIMMSNYARKYKNTKQRRTVKNLVLLSFTRYK